MKSADASAPGQSFALQVIYPDQTGMLARIVQTIGRHGGDLGCLDLLGPSARLTTRGVSIRARDEQHLEEIVAAVRCLDKVKVVDICNASPAAELAAKKGVTRRSPRRNQTRRRSARHRTTN